MGIKELLDILCCPKCKSALNLNEREDQLTCLTCKRIYPIRNNIPILLIDEAIPIPSSPEGLPGFCVAKESPPLCGEGQGGDGVGRKNCRA